MSLPDIAPAPQRITAGSQEPCRRGRRRLQASFRRAGSCTFWRLGFRQSSFRHIARISRHVIPYAWAWPPVFWHATVPFAFQIRVSHQIQRYLLSSLDLMAYPDLKGEGNCSMPENRWPCPGVRDDVPGDPRDMAKAGLPEPQSPEGARTRPPERRL